MPSTSSSAETQRNPASRFWVAAAFVAVVAAAFYFRLYPVSYFPRLSATNSAQLVIFKGIHNQIKTNVGKIYGHLPAADRQGIEKAKTQEALAKNKKKVKSETSALAQRILKASAERPSEYLMEIDPFYYLNLVRNIAQTGRMASQIRGDVYFNDKMMAPLGAWYPWDLHPYVGFIVYRALALAKPQIPLTTALACVPFVLALLIAAAAFGVFRGLMRASLAATVTGALYLLLVPVFLRRSLFGWFDTDAYNVLFPLAVTGLLFYALDAARTRRERLTAAVAAALCTALHALFWRGWLLSYAFVLVALLAGVAAGGVRHGTEKRSRMLLLAVFAVLPLVCSVFIVGWDGVRAVFEKASALTATFLKPQLSLWPDAFLTVGELKPLTAKEFAGHAGGILFSTIGAAGIALSVIDAVKKRAALPWAPLVFLSVLLAETVFAAFTAHRLSLFFAVPNAFALVWTLGQAERRATTRVKRVLAAVLFAGLAAVLGVNAHKAVRYEHSIYNSSWDRAMQTLNQKTPPDSIVNSWWAPGHFITGVAERRVTFDAATQNTPQSYWIARALLESSEANALGILRMLNTSGNQAVDFLLARNIKLSESVALINRVVPLPRTGAEAELMKHLDATATAELLALTHGDGTPPPSYVLIYNDLVEKALALEYQGRWDIAKAEALNEKISGENGGALRMPRRGSKTYVEWQWALAEGPWAQDQEASEVARDGDTVLFSNGLRWNTAAQQAYLESETFGRGFLRSVYRIENGTLVQKKFTSDKKSPMALPQLSALLIEDRSGDQTRYRAVLADEQLVTSMLFRLYYLKGAGLRAFKPFDEVENLQNRTRIYTYEIDWS